MAVIPDRHGRRRAFGTESQHSSESTPAPAAREYLSIRQLAQLTPWSTDAIEKMVRRGTFQRGVHYFQPSGTRTQLIFKWGAIVSWLESTSDGRPAHSQEAAQDLLVKGPLDVAKAEENLGRLLGR